MNKTKLTRFLAAIICTGMFGFVVPVKAGDSVSNKIETLNEYHKYARVATVATILPSIVNGFQNRPNKNIHKFNTYIWHAVCLMEATIRKALEKEKPLEQYVLEVLNDFPYKHSSSTDMIYRAVYLVYKIIIEKLAHKYVDSSACPNRKTRKFLRTSAEILLFAIPLLVSLHEKLPPKTTSGSYSETSYKHRTYMSNFEYTMLREEIAPEVLGEVLYRGYVG